MLRDYYQDAISAIMLEYGVKPAANAHYVVTPRTPFEQVLQHTDRFIGKTSEKGQRHSQYRYRRYQEVLLQGVARLRRNQSNGPIVHIDIGCGAGLFSWVLLDFARGNSKLLSQIKLLGTDHNPAMLHLADLCRERLREQLPVYPRLQYTDNTAALPELTKRTHYTPTRYIFTFGHVLVQSPGVAPEMGDIISNVVHQMHRRSECLAIAVDAKSGSTQLDQSWRNLVNTLRVRRVHATEAAVTVSAINDPQRAKILKIGR